MKKLSKYKAKSTLYYFLLHFKKDVAIKKVYNKFAGNGLSTHFVFALLNHFITNTQRMSHEKNHRTIIYYCFNTNWLCWHSA
ncbi:hypothetical protein [Moraxella lacunata]|uniref:hypothetical protein n=1 Tax=Moraxella lacunata TaxID=477 RepID=UPI003EE347F4